MAAAVAASSSSAGGSAGDVNSKMTKQHEEIVKGFQKLRQEQRAMVDKVSELSSEITEHKNVIAALEKVDVERKCYRMINQALVERKVGDVLPELKLTKTNLEQMIEKLQQQVETKGKEIVEYKTKHDIKIQGESG